MITVALQNRKDVFLEKPSESAEDHSISLTSDRVFRTLNIIDDLNREAL